MPELCIALLEPERYKRPIAALAEGKRALTHLALIDIDGTLRRCYVKAFATDDAQPADRPWRCLLNEIVGYTVAHHAGLPQPHAGLIRLQREQLLLLFPKARIQEDGIVCFVSVEAHDPANSTTGMAKALFSALADLQQELLGWKRFAAVMAFDTWLANVDRNTGNLIRIGPREFSIIDHSDVLTGPRWRAEDLDGSMDFPNKILDLAFKADALPLPIKSAIVDSATRLWHVYRKAEPELAFWLGGDGLRAWHFIWRRVETAEPLLRQRVQLVV